MTDRERLKQLEVTVENLQLKYNILEQQLKSMRQMPNPMAIVGTGFDASNDVYKSKGELIITRKELMDICRQGFDRKYIDKVIDVIFDKYAHHYGTLTYAIRQWIAVDPNRPENENEFLINECLPPISEQQRLNPNKAIKDMAFFERQNNQVNWKDKEVQWRKEIQDEEDKKTPEQKEKDKIIREKILNGKYKSTGISERLKAKIEASGLSYQEFIDYSNGIKK
jgi:hypothetical protein